MIFEHATIRWISALHEFWYRLSDGWIGSNVMGAPILLLDTTGRKTGRRYTTPLLYLNDGDHLIVIASNGGSDRDPAWWRNLRAAPQVEVQVQNKRKRVRAEAAQGDERARLWAKITSRYPVYRSYERRTTRQIPVVVLRTDP